MGGEVNAQPPLGADLLLKMDRQWQLVPLVIFSKWQPLSSLSVLNSVAIAMAPLCEVSEDVLTGQVEPNQC